LPANVKIMGEVNGETLADIYRAADFGFNPMTMGSGTNIKMLDFMAAGLTIVTTPTGARGLDGADGVHWHVAEIGGFAATARAAVNGYCPGHPLGAAARELAQQHYDWRAIAARLAVALRALTPEPAAEPAPDPANEPANELADAP
jgi:glycosyltransferase involved in cell wall biosynthesis